MLFRKTVCPICSGHGFTNRSSQYSIWSERCTNCQNGVIEVPVTNGDLIRRSTNDQLVRVRENLKNWAIYSGEEPNRLLDSSNEDFKLWLDKATDSTDLETIFDFVEECDYERSWPKTYT